MAANAYDAEIDGIYYNFSGDEAIVTYQKYQLYYPSYISDYTGAVVIPASVTHNGKTYTVIRINDHAFYGCGLTSITIPNSVTSIGDYAFYGCNCLTSITIPNSVTSIGDYTFYGCSGLTSITIPDSVTSIGSFAFYSCSNLTSIIIPEGVTSIGGFAFGYCISLTFITIPEGVTTIGGSAFHACSSLTSIAIPEGVTNIGDCAFDGCSSLTSICIPGGVTSIGGSAFRDCSSLTSICIPEGVISIGSSAFYGCSNLTSVRVEEGNAVYDSRNNCNAIIETVTNTLIVGCQNTIIPNNVTSIGFAAFYGCSGLTSVTIGNGVISIGNSAFRDCSGLTSITIPNSVTSIGSDAFNGCKLRNVLSKCTTPPSGSSAFSKQTYYHTTLYIPIGSWDAYAYDDSWYLFHNIRETATEEEQLSMQHAYTMMDAEAFTYSVYDPVNNRISTISSIGIDENNPNHSWQVIEEGGNRYLYNMGAKKFVETPANGTFTLTDTPTSINMGNGDKGIILGAQTAKQWALVSNEHMNVEDAIIDGIREHIDSNDSKDTWFTIDGLKLDKPQKGINIIRYADGTTRKVLVK